MRRLLVAGALAAVLLGAAACTGETPAPGASTQAATGAPAASAAAEAKAVCDEFNKLFAGQGTAGLTVAIGGLLKARQGTDAAKTAAAEEKVRTELTALQAAVTELSAKAVDPALKATFEQVAANVGKAADLAFLEGTTKAEELEAKLTPAFLSWIMPLATTCA